MLVVRTAGHTHGSIIISARSDSGTSSASRSLPLTLPSGGRDETNASGAWKGSLKRRLGSATLCVRCLRGRFLRRCTGSSGGHVHYCVSQSDLGNGGNTPRGGRSGIFRKQDGTHHT